MSEALADSPIAHVSDTALWVAAFRAEESERPDALFRDPLAARLAGDDGRRIARTMPNATKTRWSVGVRTVVIDELIHDAIDEGVDTVLNLGAGLDTRPYRLEVPPSLRWVEVDYPRVVDLKEQRLGDVNARCRLERNALDLTDVTARRALFEALGTASSKTLVLTEGLVPYLSIDEAASLADDVRAQRAFSLWITDYFAPELLRYMKRRPQLRNAPFRFDPPDWERFFAEHRWRAREMKYLGEQSERLGRTPPLGLTVRVLSIFKPSLRTKVLKMTGYALLEAV